MIARHRGQLDWDRSIGQTVQQPSMRGARHAGPHQGALKCAQPRMGSGRALYRPLSVRLYSGSPGRVRDVDALQGGIDGPARPGQLTQTPAHDSGGILQSVGLALVYGQTVLLPNSNYPVCEPALIQVGKPFCSIIAALLVAVDGGARQRQIQKVSSKSSPGRRVSPTQAAIVGRRSCWRGGRRVCWPCAR